MQVLLIIVLALGQLVAISYSFYISLNHGFSSLTTILISLLVALFIWYVWYVSIGRKRIRNLQKVQIENLPWNYFLKSWWDRRSRGKSTRS